MHYPFTTLKSQRFDQRRRLESAMMRSNLFSSSFHPRFQREDVRGQMGRRGLGTSGPYHSNWNANHSLSFASFLSFVPFTEEDVGSLSDGRQVFVCFCLFIYTRHVFFFTKLYKMLKYLQ